LAALPRPGYLDWRLGCYEKSNYSNRQKTFPAEYHRLWEDCWLLFTPQTFSSSIYRKQVRRNCVGREYERKRNVEELRKVSEMGTEKKDVKMDKSREDKIVDLLAKHREIIWKLLQLGGPKKVLFNEMIWNLIYICLYILYTLYCAVGMCFFIAGAFIEYGNDYIKKEIIPEYARKENDIWKQEAYYRRSIKTVAVMSGYIGSYVVIFGSLCSIVGILGIIGLARRVHCFMLFGAIANFLFLIFWFSVSLILSLGEVGITEILAYFFSRAITSHYIFDNENTDKSGFTLAWDEIQGSLKCCASDEYTEFRHTINKVGNYSVPASCCVSPKNRDCWLQPNASNSYIGTPCKTAIWEMVDPYVEMVSVISSYIETMVLSLFWLSSMVILKLVLIWRYKIRLLNEANKKA
ncbi:cd9 antigen, partial [Cichlidogyrus casuarinus]